MSVGLVGKAPCQADFIRLNASDSSAVNLLRWMEEGHEAVLRSGTKLLSDAIFFVLNFPGSPRLLAGVMKPHQDRVGRSFPLAVFTPVEAGNFPLIIEAAQPFWSAATALLDDASQLDLDALTLRLQGVPTLSPTDYQRAAQHLTHILKGDLLPVLRAALERQGQAGGSAYGVRTFASACRAQAHVTLDCPIDSVITPTLWLELSRRLLGGADCTPSWLWTDGTNPRMLLSLGAAVPNALVYLSKPSYSNGKFWPLWTSKPEAIVDAQAALTVQQSAALNASSGTLLPLFLALAT